MFANRLNSTGHVQNIRFFSSMGSNTRICQKACVCKRCIPPCFIYGKHLVSDLFSCSWRIKMFGVGNKIYTRTNIP